MKSPVKFMIKFLILILITSSTLLLTQTKSNAQVQMKVLANIVESCQRDVSSPDYYQQMLLNMEENLEEEFDGYLETCIRDRYYYSLILSRLPWLTSKGEIFSGYPASVVIGRLLYPNFYHNDYTYNLLDCLINQDASSDVCSLTRSSISEGTKIRENVLTIYSSYLVYVCPSCVVAHDEVSGSNVEILKSFMQWFLTLDKPERRELISIIEENIEFRWLLRQESYKAVEEYRQARARVEQQERQRRRQELLGQ